MIYQYFVPRVLNESVFTFFLPQCGATVAISQLVFVRNESRIFKSFVSVNQTKTMPLIILVGFPSSGKSKTAEEIKVYFESQKQKVVHIVSENNIVKKSGISKNNVYMSSPDEKSIRAQLKSDCLRLLNKTDLVIMDGGNYIKGYRYELYCASKAAR